MPAWLKNPINCTIQIQSQCIENIAFSPPSLLGPLLFEIQDPLPLIHEKEVGWSQKVANCIQIRGDFSTDRGGF